MAYLVFASRALADKRNAAEATARGCTGDVTTYWWAWAYNETTGQCALAIPDTDAARLTAAETLAAVAALTGTGWPGGGVTL